jgi:hypothetical protein
MNQWLIVPITYQKNSQVKYLCYNCASCLRFNTLYSVFPKNIILRQRTATCKNHFTYYNLRASSIDNSTQTILRTQTTQHTAHIVAATSSVRMFACHVSDNGHPTPASTFSPSPCRRRRRHDNASRCRFLAPAYVYMCHRCADTLFQLLYIYCIRLCIYVIVSSIILLVVYFALNSLFRCVTLKVLFLSVQVLEMIYFPISHE